jgi:mannitol-1-phosphate 5-dehydrogenase
MEPLQDKKILIWGAGKIGRGFVAEAFYAGGYDLSFVDADQELIDNLNTAGAYEIVKATPEGEPETVRVDRLSAFHVSSMEKIDSLVETVPYIAVAVFPKIFDVLADALVPGITARVKENTPLDIFVCANARGAADLFREKLEERLDERTKEYFNAKVGLVDTVIMRIAIPTPERFASYGPLTVTTNGFPYMPVGKNDFIGAIPDVPILRPIDEIEAEETRKFYTYNMAHATFAYAGSMRGKKTILEAAADPLVVAEVEGALEEASQALQGAFGYSQEEMTDWNAQVIKNLTNPLLEDTLVRLGGDPIRKLGLNDRLVGPAVLCKRQGKLPYYLTKAIARAFFFDPPEDPAAATLQSRLKTDGVFKTLQDVAELHRDPELVSMVAEHFRRIHDGRDRKDTPERIAALREAYERGFYYEKKYHGCAQCALASMFDASGETDETLFQATSAMAGGVGLTGDGICGGYAAGVLWMGRYIGRRLEHFDGDKEAQYKSFDMTQRLRDRYMETYGSITCKHIHESIFGRYYILKTKPVRNEFEEAGGHADRCTSVVAMASMWTTEILIDEGYITPTEAQNDRKDDNTDRTQHGGGTVEKKPQKRV